ncbi:hypothetical protein OF83DRAFT_1212020 [Amylostereum chailletii]|nr:hypothetical protein OF83DRAFT_1212020 [Amylostereum chailletii]
MQANGVLPLFPSHAERVHFLPLRYPFPPDGGISPRSPQSPQPHRLRERQPHVVSQVASSSGSVSLSYREGVHQPSDVSLMSVRMTPKFHRTQVKCKGHSMEATQWILSSEELQTIVSKAIKQSAEPHYIHLLSLQAPQAQCMLTAVSTQADTGEVNVQHLCAKLYDLRAVMGSMDELAEQLYDTRYQAQLLYDTRYQAQLVRLASMHSSSALAVALWKLNASFSKRTKEAKELVDKVAEPEEERDEMSAATPRSRLHPDRVERDPRSLNVDPSDASVEGRSRRGLDLEKLRSGRASFCVRGMHCGCKGGGGAGFVPPRSQRWKCHLGKPTRFPFGEESALTEIEGIRAAAPRSTPTHVPSRAEFGRRAVRASALGLEDYEDYVAAVANSGYTGRRTMALKSGLWTDGQLDRLGLQACEWDGRKEDIILDDEGRIFAALTGVPHEDDEDGAREPAQ